MVGGRLMRARGIYHVEFSVPAELLQVIGRLRIVKSLSTRDLTEASSRMGPIVKDISDKLAELLTAHREAKAAAQYPATGVSLLESGLNAPAAPTSDRITYARETLYLLNSETTFGVSEADARTILQIVDHLTRQFHIPVEKYSRRHSQLCREIVRIQKEAAALASVRPAAASSVKDGVLDNHDHREFLKEATLREVIAFFQLEFKGLWNGTHAQRYNHAFRLMLDLLGADTPIRTLTRRDFTDARSVMDRLSPDYTWNLETRHLPVREAAIKSVELGLPVRSIVTVNHLMKAFRSLMIYAENEGYVDKDCTARLFRVPRHYEVKRILPFNRTQLNLIFNNSSVYFHDITFEERGARFWIPLIALWTGLRIGECAQLHAADITVLDGIPVIEVTGADTGDPATDKFLKTQNSRRVVPIHPILEKIGLVAYARMIGAKGHIKLFPLTKRRMMRFNLLSNQMCADLRKAGAQTPQHSARSFRHTFRDAARNAEIPNDVVCALGGWKQRSISDGYGIGLGIHNLYGHVCRISYPGLDLSHLMPDCLPRIELCR
jgi:integrase